MCLLDLCDVSGLLYRNYNNSELNPPPGGAEKGTKMY